MEIQLGRWWVWEDGGSGKMVGLGRLELPTSPLSGVRSNQAELQTHLRGARILLEKGYLRKAFTAQIIGPDNT